MSGPDLGLRTLRLLYGEAARPWAVGVEHLRRSLKGVAALGVAAG